MRRSFSLPLNGGLARRGPRLWLQVAGVVLTILNIALLFLLVDPPGGSRGDLTEQSQALSREMIQARSRSARVRNVAGKVQIGSTQSDNFEAKYFLPKRTAYEAVMAEIQRMAQASGIQERDAVFSEEPIEGSADLSVLNLTANYEGTYQNLMHFLYEGDKSPMLLMLDTLTASPQQHGNQINASIRFQTIIKDEPAALAGGQP